MSLKTLLLMSDDPIIFLDIKITIKIVIYTFLLPEIYKPNINVIQNLVDLFQYKNRKL